MDNPIHGWWIADKTYHKCVEVTKKTSYGIHDNGMYLVKISDVEYETTYHGNYCRVYKDLNDCKEAIIEYIKKDIPYYQNLLRETSCMAENLINHIREVCFPKYANMYIQDITRDIQIRKDNAKRQLERIEKMIQNVQEFGESKYLEV